MGGTEQLDGAFLKATAITSVTAASLIGVVPPVIRFGKATDHPSTCSYILRAFTAGVMMALAFVHVIADGQERLDGLSGDFPVAQAMVMSGIVMMFIVEQAGNDCTSESYPAGARMDRRDRANDSEASPHLLSMEEGLLTECLPQEPGAGRDVFCTHDRCWNGYSHERRQVPDYDHGDIYNKAGKQHVMLEVGELPMYRGKDGFLGSSESRGEHSPVHAHHRSHVMLGMLELGIIAHSLVVGVAFGAAQYRTNAAVGYIIALSFHQLFEGMGLGISIASCMQKVFYPPFPLLEPSCVSDSFSVPCSGRSRRLTRDYRTAPHHPQPLSRYSDGGCLCLYPAGGHHRRDDTRPPVGFRCGLSLAGTHAFS